MLLYANRLTLLLFVAGLVSVGCADQSSLTGWIDQEVDIKLAADGEASACSKGASTCSRDASLKVDKACCGKCQKGAAADAAAIQITLCGKCGEAKETGRCCAEGAAVCDCGLHKGSPGCCKIEPGTDVTLSSAASCSSCDGKCCGCGEGAACQGECCGCGEGAACQGECCGCGKNKVAAVSMTLCGACGHLKESEACCADGDEVCACGLHKGSPGCCKIKPGKDVALCTGCGEAKGSEACCADGAEKCACGMNKGAPGCCAKKKSSLSDAAAEAMQKAIDSADAAAGV